MNKKPIAYVVYHIDSLTAVKTYRYEKAAHNRIRYMTGYAVADLPTFQDMVANGATKVVRNLMTGAEITIPRNTPLCCDPSSETYWSI